MAAGWLRHLAGDTVEVRSAGSEPADPINPVAVEAMRDVGIDITDQTPILLTWDTAEASDVIVTMGCGDACPVFPGKRSEDWQLTDPAGQPPPSYVRSATRSGPGWRPCSPTCEPPAAGDRPPGPARSGRGHPAAVEEKQDRAGGDSDAADSRQDGYQCATAAAARHREHRVAGSR